MGLLSNAVDLLCLQFTEESLFINHLLHGAKYELPSNLTLFEHDECLYDGQLYCETDIRKYFVMIIYTYRIDAIIFKLFISSINSLFMCQDEDENKNENESFRSF